MRSVGNDELNKKFYSSTRRLVKQVFSFVISLIILIIVVSIVVILLIFKSEIQKQNIAPGTVWNTLIEAGPGIINSI